MGVREYFPGLKMKKETSRILPKSMTYCISYIHTYSIHVSISQQTWAANSLRMKLHLCLSHRACGANHNIMKHYKTKIHKFCYAVPLYLYFTTCLVYLFGSVTIHFKHKLFLTKVRMSLLATKKGLYLLFQYIHWCLMGFQLLVFKQDFSFQLPRWRKHGIIRKVTLK